MSETKPGDQSRQNRESEVARELFTRDRGEHRDVPFTEFLSRIESEAREQVREERRKKPRE